MQYTLRNIPKKLDKALRQHAKQRKKSLNQATVDLLSSAMGVSSEPIRYRDLDFIVGTWVEDPEFDKAIEDMRRIDPEMWK